MSVHHSTALGTLREAAIVLAEDARDDEPLLAMVGERPFVLLGEATHGTDEFYRMRARITRRLVAEAGFDAVVVEADWPDAYRLNRYVLGHGDATLDEAFGDFERFPAWMWRNHAVRDFIAWLHAHNAGTPPARRVGFYGMDLYSLYRSADAVVDYLEGVDPAQAALARRLVAALDHVRDPQDYGAEAAAGLRPSCQDAAAALLVDLRRKASGYVAGDGDDHDGNNGGGNGAGRRARDAQFQAECNARAVRDAEHYYRAMFGRRSNTWNLRDRHMVDTVLALRRHLRREGRSGRIVVWAHNSHLGDARATQMHARGEVNVGQLLREEIGAAGVLLVGFTTYTGHVTAARDWGGPAERRWVRPAHKDSCEHLFHASGRDRFFLPLRADVAQVLAQPLLERAIGVLYRPETELPSHYFHARLAAQFDAVFHLDETTAVEPFDIGRHWTRHELPDTYPSGL